MKQPLMHKTKTIRKMGRKEWCEHLSHFFDHNPEYKGKALQDFDNWNIDKVQEWLKDKEKEYTQAIIEHKDTDFIKAEIVHCKQTIATRRAKYVI